MKYTNKELPHAWVHQHAASGEGSNLFFEQDIIYSYGKHFPIAKIVKNNRYGKTILFTSQGYSNTTAKHKSFILYAIPDYIKVFTVQDVTANGKESHRKNLQYLIEQAEKSFTELEKSRNPLILQQNALDKIRNARQYAETFEIKLLKKEIKTLTDLENKIDANEEIYRQRTDRYLMLRKEAEEKKEERAKARAAKELEKFRAFETSYVNSPEWNRAYLRYNTDTKRVETSKGVVIPAEAARRFYNWLKATIKNGGCEGECTQKILNYEVRYVNAGEFKVGCHTIAMAEADSLAKELNWK